MNKDNGIGVICLMVFLFIAGLFVGYASATKVIRAEAITHGYAEWVIIGVSGNTEFKWKELKPQKKAVCPSQD